MAEKIINMADYPRREHFKYFSSLSYPYFGVTVNCDVTELVSACKARGWSFYLTFIHVSALAADAVPELRRRIRGTSIVEFDRCITSHTELLEDGTYCYCTLRHDMPFDEYIPYAVNEREKSRSAPGIEEDDETERAYFISCLPWLDYTSLIQPAGGGEDSNPRITWGKYSPDARGRLVMPVSILVHHALADGLHVSAFYRELEKQIAALSDI